MKSKKTKSGWRDKTSRPSRKAPSHGAASFPTITRLYSTNLYRLVGAFGSATAFVNAVKPEYAAAAAVDLRRFLQTTLDISQRGDTQFGSLAWLAYMHSDDATANDRFNTFMQSACVNDRKLYRARLTLEKAAQPIQ